VVVSKVSRPEEWPHHTRQYTPYVIDILPGIIVVKETQCALMALRLRVWYRR
jgi:hypothetical protein